MNKACPVILRRHNGELQVLAFEHPLAGRQIVKGTIEPGEALDRACIRELSEESGIQAQAGAYLGQWQAEYEQQHWGFYRMHYTQPLPEQWQHWCNDDGGLLFTFFWQSLAEPLDDRWHPLFVGAIEYLCSVIEQR